MQKEVLARLASEKSNPSVTITLNTHRTHPDNVKDGILLRNLCKEASDRVIEEFGKRDTAPLIAQINRLPEIIDINYNLDSLHIFVSATTCEYVRSAWPAHENQVQISDHFALRGLIKAYNRSETYLILHLSQSGVNLYEAQNDAILEEIQEEGFPFSENQHYATEREKLSDPKTVDNLVREFLNKVDKALVRIHNQSDLRCVVVCTEDNYSRLLQVADKPGVYIGNSRINYNQTALHHLSAQSWEIVQAAQEIRRQAAVSEVREAIARNKVLTDIHAIYRAALEGRADLLLVEQDYSQPVLQTGDYTIELIEDVSVPGAIDDVISLIAWEVISKKGRAEFVAPGQLSDLGKISLKVRY